MVKVAIFHEGNANKSYDNELLKLLLKTLELDLSYVKFVGMGSKSNFFKSDNDNYKEVLLDVKRKAINKILFIVDADYEENDSTYGGYTNTQTALTSIIETLDIEKYSYTYIMCDPRDRCGYLESFILSTISEEQKNCIETFLECSDFTSKENHKAILNQIYKTAYPKAPYDFLHENFNELKQKLQTLFEGIEK